MLAKVKAVPVFYTPTEFASFNNGFQRCPLRICSSIAPSLRQW